MTTETTGRLAGKVAVITGGVSGMGLGTVRLFLEQGAKVIVGDVQDEPGRRLEAELGEHFRYQRCDVAKEADVAALVQRAVDEFGRLDCMFNPLPLGGQASVVLQARSRTSRSATAIATPSTCCSPACSVA